MANFCGQCGAPVNGAFCGGCGARAGVPSPAVPVAAPTAGANSAVKIIAIVVGVLLLLGALGTAGLLYVGYKAKERITAAAKEQGFDLDSSRRGPSRVALADGCQHLSASEASAILGVKIIRTESRAPEGCTYFGDPAETASRLETQANEGRKEIESGKADEGGAQDAVKAMEKIMEGISGGAAANGQLFSFEIKSDGRNSWAAFQLSSKIMGGLGGEAEMRKQGVTLFESVNDLGDKAMFAPMGAGLFVLKGDAFIQMNFAGAAINHDKKVEIARKVIAKL